MENKGKKIKYIRKELNLNNISKNQKFIYACHRHKVSR